MVKITRRKSTPLPLNLNLAKPYATTLQISVWIIAQEPARISVLKIASRYPLSTMIALYVARVGYLGRSYTVTSTKSSALMKEDVIFAKNGNRIT